MRSWSGWTRSSRANHSEPGPAPRARPRHHAWAYGFFVGLGVGFGFGLGLGFGVGLPGELEGAGFADALGAGVRVGTGTGVTERCWSGPINGLTTWTSCSKALTNCGPGAAGGPFCVLDPYSIRMFRPTRA